MQPEAQHRIKDRAFYTPFLGRGILGSGWQRQTFSPAETVLILLALVRARSPIRGSFAATMLREAARFLVKRAGGVVGVGGSEPMPG
jgi:hypothetical protein